MFEKDKFFKKINYKPHEKQQDVHNSDARFRIVAAGARAGKSMLTGAEIAYELTKANRRIWCVANQYELADREFNWVLEFLSDVKVNGKAILNYGKLISPSRGSRILKFPWNSFCQTKSTEKPQGLLGEELDFLALGEASQIAKEPWQRMLRARLGPRQGKLLATSTPNTDVGLFINFFKNGRNEKMEDWESWQFSTLANPTFLKSEWEIAKKELDEKVFQEQYEGKFVSRRGSVFNLKDEDIIFSEMPGNIENWSIVVGIQKGYTNPYIVVFVAINPNDRSYWVIDEIFEREKLTDDIITQMIELQKGRRIIATIIDYYDYGLQEELKKNGISPTWNNEKKYSKNFGQIRRIQAIQNIIKKGKLHFSKDCQKTYEEMKALKWHDAQREEKERAELEVPLTKYLQSAMAISYVIAFCEQAQGKSIYEYGLEK